MPRLKTGTNFSKEVRDLTYLRERLDRDNSLPESWRKVALKTADGLLRLLAAPGGDLPPTDYPAQR